ncbi:regulatory-associated protein of mTOR-like isoform X2 [Branchiostoma floridae x Branchiostoma japonicum]
MALSAYEDISEEDECDLQDWQLPLAYMKKRHVERVEGSRAVTQTWRMKERMKTVSVALVLCLNVGVDPPDVIKPSPCARQECWIDPLSMSPQKALEAIGANLQKQYERWQPRARYKQSLDPTVEEVKKLCSSLRRNAKEERVLFHYNGHGVPRPTVNGEIWVFNKSYTQYIPLSIYDLQTWMGSPSIFVYDCSNAGVILDSFKQFAAQREQEIELAKINAQSYPGATQMPLPPSMKNCIQLAACGPKQLLPMNPELPADLFTSCLTTPIKIALRWFVHQRGGKLVPSITEDLIEKIPGRLNDRRTPLGELNWIFTAITDTIAWNTLPRELFQKLFRQDLLVASLFRNFLLAERIMRSYNCTPLSSPRLPPTYQHPMWQAWDLAVDHCLSQLPAIVDDGAAYRHSPFFADQLTAFQVWLTMGTERRDPPEQLPIVLQVLLSQVHRLRALDLLGRFLDLGPWAVSLALSVGIFPYVLKLLQSSARELRPLLVFIWAKILAVDSSCQADLVKDNGHKYFLSVLADPYMPAEHRTMAAFVLAVIVNDYTNGQEACLQGNLIAICLEQLNDAHHLLRQWLAICLGRIWTNFDAARWCGVRDSAHEKLYILLNDPVPEVRAAAVFALGCFIGNCSERTDHANTIDQGVGMKLTELAQDGAVIVRKELVVALHQLVLQFESNFASIALHFIEEERQREQSQLAMGAAVTPGGWTVVVGGSPSSTVNSSVGSCSTPQAMGPRSRLWLQTSYSDSMSGSYPSSGLQPMSSPSRSNSSASLSSMGSIEGLEKSPAVGDKLDRSIKRVSSSSSVSSLGFAYNNVYATVWRTLVQIVQEPHSEVAETANTVVNAINLKATMNTQPKFMRDRRLTHSAPSSPTNSMARLPTDKVDRERNTDSPDGAQLQLPHEIARPLAIRAGEQPPPSRPPNPAPIGSAIPHSSTFQSKRRLFDKGPNSTYDDDDDVSSPPSALITTEFCEWSSRYFAQSVMKFPEEHDPQSPVHYDREWRFIRNARVRREAREMQKRAVSMRLDDQIFINRNKANPTVVKFHPYDPHMAVADKDGISIWNWDQGARTNYFRNNNAINSRITALDFINAHDITLLLSGSDDGAVRIWREYGWDGECEPELVTAWQAISDLLPSTRGSGLVVDWEQESGMLLASGDVRIIRVWDTQKEKKLQDIPTGADSCVTSLVSDSVGRSLLIAGCGDGSVRLFDRRLAPNECRVMTLREHTGWVVKVFLQKGSEGNIISASVGGDLKFWDPRFSESVKTIQTSQGLASFDVHPQAEIFACGSANQFISLYTLNGENISTIKYHDGFMGQRIGPISCLAFHPHWVHLAAGSTDCFLSVYGERKQKQ